PDLLAAAEIGLSNPRPNTTRLLHPLDDSIDNRRRDNRADVAGQRHLVLPKLQNVGALAAGHVAHERLPILKSIVGVKSTLLNRRLTTRRLHRTRLVRPDLDRRRDIQSLRDLLPLTHQLVDLLFHRFQIQLLDRKSTRLNSSHVKISYAVFCLKKKNT